MFQQFIIAGRAHTDGHNSAGLRNWLGDLLFELGEKVEGVEGREAV